ncbi:DNA adenine methylase [Neisseria perflava]|uniref:DNA adenine methylase n=1 Tax=Neisseria perflava TaxID=33053 RepID=UPI00209EE921|nr:Dam family site-specific DNA-(adenine-N6)-methyltransferase [Neisseria perflava]MCP1772055.1 DNA adenine methylase [Neisseria perflava]
MTSKPFLKWAGGKSKLAAFIESHLPDTKRQRLVEPFAGSAAVSLALEFEAYLLNDINEDLINLYQILKSEKQSFIDYARSFFTPDNNQELRFYELREQFNNSENTIERSALFIYLNRHAFNGLCRYNSKGGFNVPFGRYRQPYFPLQEMSLFIEKSDRMHFIHGDFQSVFQQIDIADTVYCDPPYAPLKETSSFTTYAKGGFNMEEQIQLAQTAEQAYGQVQGILISNHDTPFTRDIYRGARIDTIHVQRNIAANGSSREKVGELLAIYE